MDGNPVTKRRVRDGDGINGGWRMGAIDVVSIPKGPSECHQPRSSRHPSAGKTRRACLRNINSVFYRYRQHPKEAAAARAVDLLRGKILLGGANAGKAVNITHSYEVIAA